MAKLADMNEKIAEAVVGGYKKIEDTVTSGYKKMESGIVGGFEKVSDACVETLFAKEGETTAEAKERLVANAQRAAEIGEEARKDGEK